MVITLLCLLMAGASFVVAADAAVYGGSCGASVTWSLDTSTGVLTLEGSGPMTDYERNGAPWNSQAGKIRTVRVAKDITHIGANAFSSSILIQSILFDEGSLLESLGNDAFLNLAQLTEVTFDAVYTPIEGNSDYGYSQLSPELKFLYFILVSDCEYILHLPTDYVSEQMIAGRPMVRVFNVPSSFATLSEQKQLRVYFLMDSPAYYFLCSDTYGVGGGSGENADIVILMESEYASAAARSSAAADIEEMKSRCADALSGESGDRNIALAIHDFICETCEYAWEDPDLMIVSEEVEPHNIVGTARGLAVCEGYAEAFQYLGTIHGLDVICLGGFSRSIAHEWNYVKINGLWYGVDSTWDDQEGSVIYAFFGLSETDMASKTIGLDVCNHDRVPEENYETLPTLEAVSLTVCAETPSGPFYIASEPTASVIELVPVAGCEYSLDGASWQDSPRFTGLQPSTDYAIYIRVKRTEELRESAPIRLGGLQTKAKKSGPAAPGAPTLATKSLTTVTLVATAGYEYSKDGTVWQTSPTFESLSAGVTYTFYQRVAPTDEVNPSAASAGLSVTTEACPSHEWDEGVVTLEPTHTESGERTFTCQNCWAVHVETISPLGHAFDQQNTDEAYLKTEATCTSRAVYYYSCSCGEIGSETFDYGDMLPHEFLHYVSDNNATCTQDGTETATCEHCTAVDTRTEAGSMLPHSFTNYVYNEDATCEHDGTETATCDNCPATDTRTAEGTLLPHDFSEEWSFRDEGHYHVCRDCGIKDEILPHTPGPAATETEPQTCTVCHYILVPALGHVHSFSSDWTSDDEFHWHACAGCPMVNAKAAHDWEENGTWVDPADEVSVYRIERCSVCGAEKKTFLYEKPLEHTCTPSEAWDSDETSHWHSCTDPDCSILSGKADHTFVPDRILVEPTKDHTGSQLYICSVCHREKEVELPRLPDNEPRESEEPGKPEESEVLPSSTGKESPGSGKSKSDRDGDEDITGKSLSGLMGCSGALRSGNVILLLMVLSVGILLAVPKKKKNQ